MASVLDGVRRVDVSSSNFMKVQTKQKTHLHEFKI